ncbi:MAG TPA: CPBP family glutamic-type intramembrane protease [Melioribacteraceae bacterium]|nr:CPBP family glutamic-type intramembrane protease [Melioribacteraceae bacterium]
MKNRSSNFNKEIIHSSAIYISASLLLYFQTHYVIPYLSSVSSEETILFWFVVAGLGVFLPLVLVGLFILKTEGLELNKNTFINRLRFKKLTIKDISLSLLGLLSVVILSALIMFLLELLIGNFNHTPAFMNFTPLTTGRYWLLIVWFPYWILNILGEEFLWRGIMLPKQEKAFGKFAWLISGTGWGIFHIAFGWQLLITLIPLIYIQTYLVQKTKNTWVGVLMHAGLNGPSFILISLGLL